ncbi:MAG TPA: hypothetical protein VLT32_10730 [Candidatus Sulfomarinibacteraceae bacterium]|nr:hypothetical protein [Candidatus Sulfomarinibacteraceae bacterium]
MTPHQRPPEPPITAAVASRDRVWLDSLAASLSRLSIVVRTLDPRATDPSCSLAGIDVLVLDSDSLSGTDLAWVDTLHADHPLVEVLAIAGGSSVADAVRALREGAFTVLQHPVTDARLAEALLAAGRRHRHARIRLDALDGATAGHPVSELDRPPARAARSRKDGR